MININSKNHKGEIKAFELKGRYFLTITKGKTKTVIIEIEKGLYNNLLKKSYVEIK